jgi:hypothetical protein
MCFCYNIFAHTCAKKDGYKQRINSGEQSIPKKKPCVSDKTPDEDDANHMNIPATPILDLQLGIDPEKLIKEKL